MRKIIFSIPITLDGFIEGPHRERDWVIPDDELHDFYTTLLGNADLLIYGRVTYELMAGYWPTAPSDTNTTESMKRFANALNPKRKIVFSRTLNQVDWNTQLERSFDPDKIMALKAESGSDILLSGGAIMAQEFFKHGLVDEYIPVIQPVAIGQGKALFNGLQELPSLTLTGSQRFNSGTVALSYSVNGKK